MNALSSYAVLNVPGPTSFQPLRFVKGITYATFRSACQALNLLENGRHWDNERALLAAKIKDVYELINIVQSNIQSKAVTYKSVDTVEEADEAVNYPTEFLHSLDLPGIPSHVHQLKIGVPIIMLRNINQPKLCHATRFAVKKINNVVEATILTGSFTGEDVLIPRIPMIPTDMPYQFKRL
ncbi:uncharacterized protein [Procambarus clarkii]|uniref:uncharacterized protein n=1 Tax=Procambarus clarkii TaxID=6728 RepID=UPI003742D34C